MELLNHLCALLLFLVFLGTCSICDASPAPEQYGLIQQTIPFVDQAERFVLPFSDTSWSDRFIEIRKNRDGYQYGPPLLGNTSFFPTGILGEARVRNDKQLWFRDVQYVTENVGKEVPLAGQALAIVSPSQDAPFVSMSSGDPGWRFTKYFKFCCFVRTSMERDHSRRRITWDIDELDTRSAIFHGKTLHQSIHCKAIASRP